MRNPPGRVLIMCTRWHQEDLIGHLRDSEPDSWEVLTLPAIADEGTDHESALWPGRYPLDALNEIKASMAAGGRLREWRAQYQQSPTSEEGTYIQRSWFTQRWMKEPQHRHVYMASDFAVTESREGADPDWTEHAVFGLDPDSNLVVLDWWSGQTTADVWIEALLDLVEKWEPLAWFGESGPIRRAIEPFLIRRCRERGVYFRQEWIASTRDKATRARAFQARAAMGKVVFPKSAAWASEVIEQCVAFPTALHDDKLDTLSLMCLAIDIAHDAVLPVEDSGPDEKRDYAPVGDEEPGWESS
jgi:predicted phage terminase large subunit-like protein